MSKELEGLDEDLANTLSTIPFERLAPHLQEKILRFTETLLLERSRTSFYQYVKTMAPLFLPMGYVDGKHVRVMANALQDVAEATERGEVRRLMIFLPPGGMKTTILNLYVTWCLGRNPAWAVLHVGHSAKFAEDIFGRLIRDFLISPDYNRVFPNTILKTDTRAAGRWETTKKGRYYAVGAGGKLAGRRANISICDDVIDEHTARSDVERSKINQWYGAGLRTRLLQKGSEIVINTRWHLEDLSGYLLEQDKDQQVKWKVISIPAILDEDGAELLGGKVGESFWPELQSKEWLLEKFASGTLTRHQKSALYDQNPVPEEGSIFKLSSIQRWPADAEPPPNPEFVLASLDTAYSDVDAKRGSYSVITVFGVFTRPEVTFDGREFMGRHLIAYEIKRGRWNFAELCRKCAEIEGVYKPDLYLIEKKASGQSLIPELRNRGFPVRPYQPDRDKVARAHSCVGTFESGRVWLPEGQRFNWADDAITELIAFPMSPHTDIVDTFTQAIIYCRQEMLIGNVDDQRVFEDDEDTDDLTDDRYDSNPTYWTAITRKQQAVV